MNKQVYDKCRPLFLKLLHFSTVFTTQEFVHLALEITRSDLTTILSKDSPLLIQGLQYVRLVLMYHKTHFTMSFLLARMLSLMNALKDAPVQNATALDLIIENLYLLLASFESRDQLVNARTFADRCDAVTAESPSIFGVAIGPCAMVADFTAFIKATEYSSEHTVRNLAIKAANYLTSYIIAPYFDHEAAERARVKAGSCRYVICRTHEAENHLYLMSYLFTQMIGSRLITHVVYTLMSFTPVVGFYNESLPSFSRSVSYGRLGIAGQEYQAPITGGVYMDSNIAGYPNTAKPSTIPTVIKTDQHPSLQSIPETAPDTIKLPQFYLQSSNTSSRTKNRTNSHIPPVTVTTLSFYPFLSCITEGFDFCESCRGRLLKTAYKDQTEVHNLASRERIFTCDRCYSSFVLGQLSTALLDSIELNISNDKEIISYNDIIALFGYIFVCHQALLTYTKTNTLLGTTDQQRNKNIQWKLLQTRRLVNSLNETVSIGGFYKSEGAEYDKLHKLKAVFENEYSSASVPLSTDFPFPSPFSLLANDECSCNKAKSLRPQKITINSTQETVTDVGHLLLKKPILSNHVFHAKEFFKDINIYKENPLWKEFDPFELSLTDVLIRLTRGKLLLHLIRHMDRFCQTLKEKVMTRDLPYHKVELVYARNIYNYSMFLGNLLDFYLSNDYSKIIGVLVSTSGSPEKEAFARHEISISKDCIDSISCLISTVRSIAQILEDDLFCYDMADDLCYPELQDDYRILESAVTARHYISTKKLPECDGVIPINEYESLRDTLIERVAKKSSTLPGEVLYDLMLELPEDCPPVAKPKKFPILSTIQDAAERDFVTRTPTSNSGSQQTAANMGSMHGSLNQTIITTSGFNGLVKTELDDQVVATLRLFGSGIPGAQSGYNNVDIDKYLNRRMRHDYLKSWQDVVMNFRANVVQCIFAGQNYEQPSNSGIDCLILKKSVLGSSTPPPSSTSKQVDPIRTSIQINAFRNKLLGLLLSTVDSAVQQRTLGLPYAMIRRKFAPQIMRQAPFEQYSERLYLHSALSTFYIGAVSPIHTYRGRGMPQIKADSSKFIHPSLPMYYSIHYIQESKYTLRFFGSNLFKDEPFDVERIKASANLLNSTISMEALLYYSYISEFATICPMLSYRHIPQVTDASPIRTKLGTSTSDVRLQPLSRDESSQPAIVLDYTQHNTEFPSICTSSYHAQSLYIVESDTHSLGVCMHNQESMMSISPAILQNNRLHISADASYADCFSVSKVSGKMGMVSPSASLYEHPALSPYRFLTELALCGTEVDLLSSILRRTSASTLHCFELLDSFLIVQNTELSSFLLQFSLLHKLHTRDSLPSETLHRSDYSVFGLPTQLLFQRFHDDLDRLGVWPEKPLDVTRSPMEHTPRIRSSSLCNNQELCAIPESGEKPEIEPLKPLVNVGTARKAGIFHPTLFTDRPRDLRQASLYYEKIDSSNSKAMLCGIDACSARFIPVRVLNQMLVISDFDETQGIDEIIDSANFSLRLHSIDTLSRILTARPVLLYNVTLLRLLASVLRALSLSTNVINLRDFASQLVLCNFVAIFISNYGLTNLAITLAGATLGEYNSVIDQPSSMYRKMRLASSIDAYLREYNTVLGHAEDFVHFVDLTCSDTRIPMFSTLFSSDPTLVIDVSTGSVIVLNVETKTLLLVPFSNYITAKWFYMQLHSIIIRYIQILLKIDFFDLTDSCLVSGSGYKNILQYIADYATMIITMKTYLSGGHLQRLSIDLYNKESGEAACERKTLILNPLVVLQHSYFLSILKDLHRQLYTHVCIAIQKTNIQSQITPHRKHLREFLLIYFYSRLTILTKHYSNYEESFQLPTATTSYRNPVLKKPSIYMLATVSLDVQSLFRKGKLQAATENYHKVSKTLSPEDNARFEELRRSVDVAFQKVFSYDCEGKDAAPLSNQEAVEDEFSSTSVPLTTSTALSLPLVEYLLMLDTLLLAMHVSVPDIGVDYTFLTSMGLVSTMGMVALWTKS